MAGYTAKVGQVELFSRADDGTLTSVGVRDIYFDLPEGDYEPTEEGAWVYAAGAFNAPNRVLVDPNA